MYGQRFKGQGPRRVIFGPVKSQNMTRWKMRLVVLFINNDSQQFQMCIGKRLTVSFYEFSMPQRVAEYLKIRKIVILAPFSVINSLTEIRSPQHDTKVFWQDNPKTLPYHLVIMRQCRVWDFIVDLLSLSSKMGQKWQFLRVWGFCHSLGQLETI